MKLSPGRARTGWAGWPSNKSRPARQLTGWLKRLVYSHKRSDRPGGSKNASLPGQGGMTLVELMVAMAVMTVVTGLLLAFLYDFFDLMRSTSARLIARHRRDMLIQAIRRDVKAAEVVRSVAGRPGFRRAVPAELASFKTGEGSLILRLPANLEDEAAAKYVVYRHKGAEVERTEFDAGMRLLKLRTFALGPGFVKMKFHLAPPPASFFARQAKGKARMLLWSEISFRKRGKKGRVTSISFCLLPRPYLPLRARQERGSE